MFQTQIHTKENKYTLGGGIDKDGRKHIKGGYETKDTNTKKISVGKNEVSKSDYTVNSHEVNGGLKKDKNGVIVDGSYSNKQTTGQKYTVNNLSVTKENEKGHKVDGKVNVNKNSVSVKM